MYRHLSISNHPPLNAYAPHFTFISGAAATRTPAITSCATRLHPSHDGQTRGNPLQPCVCTYSYLGIYLGAEISFLEGRRRLNASYDAYALFFPSPALEPMYEGACRSNIGASERAYVLRSEHIWIAFKLSRLRKSCDMLHEAMPLHAFAPRRLTRAHGSSAQDERIKTLRLTARRT